MLKSQKSTLSLLILPLLAFSLNAQGFLQDYTLQVHTGATIAGDTKVKGTNISADVGNGYVIGIGVGRQVNDNFRLQLEWTYRNMDVDNLVDPTTQWLGSNLALPPGAPSGSGFTGFSSIRDNVNNFEADLSYSSVLVNAFYDREITDKFSVFGGLGLGFSVVEASFYGEVKPGVAAISGISPRLILPGDQQGVAFTWQLALGVEYAITKDFNVVATYKYFNPGSVDDLKDLDVSSFEIGVSYLF